LLTVLGVAVDAARATNGVCTQTLLGALEAAGYDRDFDMLTGDAPARPDASAPLGPAGPPGAARRPHLGEPRQVIRRGLRRPHPANSAGRSWRAIRLDTTHSRVWLPAGCRLDLAGVAKGWTADRVADLLAQAGPCLVNAGGDLAARGAPAGFGGWPVAVADPFAPDDDLAMVLLRDAGLATSGVDYRRWTVDGRPRHHLIDPRTGQPSRTDVFTASVIAPSTTDADVLAKVAVLLGARTGLASLTHGRRAGLIVRQDGRVVTTPQWREHALAR
jgi:thiamine biosynthesis lipoprotein